MEMSAGNFMEDAMTPLMNDKNQRDQRRGRLADQ